MNVLVISTNRNEFPMPVIPLGACMVAEAAGRAGHSVHFLDMMFRRDPLRDVRQELEKVRPDVVGISVRNIDNNDLGSPEFFIREVRLLIREIQAATLSPIVLGGAAVSVMPEELLRYTNATWAVTADGETVFPLLLDELSGGRSPKKLPGVAWIEDGAYFSNASNGAVSNPLAIPDFGRWIDSPKYLRRLSTVPVQSKLGCRFSCVYCTYRKIEGSRYRLSDPGEVADAVCRLSAAGLRNIEFVDNVFNSPYDHAMAICENLARVRHGASLQSLELNPLFLDDDLFFAMEQAGFSGVGITVESASDRVLEGLGKGFTKEHVYKAAEIVRRHKLPCVWIFMLGGPNETRQTVEETLRFAEKTIRPSDVAFFGEGIRIYPGTELDSMARKHGIVSLPPSGMLEPVFYVSPEVDYRWMVGAVKNSMDTHMNFMDSGSLGASVLPLVHRIAGRLGLRPPLWRHTRFIRRGLRFLGMEV